MRLHLYLQRSRLFREPRGREAWLLVQAELHRAELVVGRQQSAQQGSGVQVHEQLPQSRASGALCFAHDLCAGREVGGQVGPRQHQEAPARSQQSRQLRRECRVVGGQERRADQTLQGTIKTISVQADKTHNVKVQIEVVNKSNELRSGMFGTAILANGTIHNALSIPRKTLVGSTKNPQVYVVKNGKALLTGFNAGTSDGDFMEIVSGVTEDDKVVIKGQVNLKNNSNVKLK